MPRGTGLLRSLELSFPNSAELEALASSPSSTTHHRKVVGAPGHCLYSQSTLEKLKLLQHI